MFFRSESGANLQGLAVVVTCQRQTRPAIMAPVKMYVIVSTRMTGSLNANVKTIVHSHQLMRFIINVFSWSRKLTHNFLFQPLNASCVSLPSGVHGGRIRRPEPPQQRGVLRLLFQPLDRGGSDEAGGQLSGRGQLRRKALCDRRRARWRHLFRQGGNQMCLLLTPLI